MFEPTTKATSASDQQQKQPQPQYQQQQRPQYEQPQPQQHTGYDPNQQRSTQGASGNKTSQQPQQPPSRTTAEPYPTQESTWWEEAQSPNPHRTEQGYGHVHGATATTATGHGGGGGGQQEFGQYGGRTHDDKRSRENQEVVNWNKVAKIICAILLPPLGVFLETGCDKSFAINVLLTILGYLPGIIHALYVIITA